MAGEIEDGGGPAPELIKEARNMGWLPQEEYKGNPDKWVDADEYVEKGKQVMPILLANNKRLQNDALTKQAQIDTLKAEIEELREATKALQDHASVANKRDVDAARDQLKARLKEAREDNDIDAEMDIQEALAALKDTPAPKSPAKPPVKKDPVDDAVSPEFKAWAEENPWFNGTDPEDRKRTKEFIRIGEDLREEGNTLAGRKFFEAIEKAYEEKHGEKQERSGKYESGNNRSQGRNNAPRSFSSLPPEAKQACREDAEAVVGPNKKFKDMKSWEAEYARLYYGEG
jgi:hypothetical protein